MVFSFVPILRYRTIRARILINFDCFVGVLCAVFCFVCRRVPPWAPFFFFSSLGRRCQIDGHDVDGMCDVASHLVRNCNVACIGRNGPCSWFALHWSSAPFSFFSPCSVTLRAVDETIRDFVAPLCTPGVHHQVMVVCDVDVSESAWVVMWPQVCRCKDKYTAEVQGVACGEN